jgi:hypothetical protein
MKLFGKRELTVRGLQLHQVNLDDVARVVASELGLAERHVIVVDARADLVTLDILDEEMPLERIAGKKQALLQALSSIPGIVVGDHADIHSEGVLGVINLSTGDAERLPAAASAISREIQAHIARRAIVLPTGSEVIAGQIADTNTPLLVEALRSAGYTADAGPAVADDVSAAIGALTGAALAGFGLVVTTGGTGAESKDCVIEAILAIDPAAATPYVAHYTRGQGRHHKDGVRLAVGSMELTTFVALTGPHREVERTAPILVEGLRQGWDKQRLATELADVLRTDLAAQSGPDPRHHR